MPIIPRKDNSATDLHTSLIRTHLGDPKAIQELGKTVAFATKHFLESNPLVPSTSSSQRYQTLSDHMDKIITSVSARCIIGADAYDHPEPIDMFLKFNKDVDNVIGMGTLMPPFLRFISQIPMNRSYKKFRKILTPIIAKRRQNAKLGQDGLLDFMPFILEVVDDDKRASGELLRSFRCT